MQCDSIRFDFVPIFLCHSVLVLSLFVNHYYYYFSNLKPSSIILYATFFLFFTTPPPPPINNRPYCSAQPQGISLPSYDDWCPFKDDDEDLKEKHRPKLPETFWDKYAPKRGCSVVSETNYVIN
jgi:hypothetical protein